MVVAGLFELIDDLGGGYRVRLLNAGGEVLAVSERYASTEKAARGIFAMREIAASALIEDRRGSFKACIPEGAWPQAAPD
jgi:uncharacterized protein YegP (UPF0339 family)